MASICDVQTRGPLVLPADLWIEFMNRLEAIDILSLCTTCKTLYLLLSQPTVWILILRSLSRQNGVYFPSYDIGNMNVQDLQRAAKGRHRWGHLLEQNCLEPQEEAPENPPILQPAYGPIKLPPIVPSSTWSDSSNYVLRALLIPGGRYLMVVDIHFVRLLDLGVPGRAPLSSPIELVKVAYDWSDGPREQTHLLAWEYDSGRLRVATGIESTSGETFVIKVYTVSLTEKNPEFEILGSLNLVVTANAAQGSWQMKAHKNKLFLDFANGSLGALWDFESGQYIVVSRVARYARYELFTDDFVARFTDDALFLWPVPSLNLAVPPDGRVRLPNFGHATQEKIFPYPFRYPQTRHDSRYLHLVSSSQPLIQFPVALDIYPQPNVNGNTEASRYLVDVTKPNPKDPSSLDVTFTLQTTYSLPGHLHGLAFVGDRTPLQLGYPSNTLVDTYVWMGSYSYTRYLSVLSVMTPPGLSNRTVERRATGKNVALTFLWAYESYCGPVAVCSLCSASGRLVYLDKDGDEIQRLFVVDYLAI